MSRIEVTRDDLLDALAAAEKFKPAPPEAMTADEIRKALGIKQTALKKRLREFLAEGRLDVWRTYRTDVTGREQMVPAYTIRPAQKTTRKRGK